MFLAELATAEAVASLDSRVAMLIRIVAFVVIVAGLMFGWQTVGAWIAAKWAKIKSDLRPAPAPQPVITEWAAAAAKLNRSRPSAVADSDSAAQSLLQQISADSTVLSAEMKVEKSNGTLELKFTAKGAASNG